VTGAQIILDNLDENKNKKPGIAPRAASLMKNKVKNYFFCEECELPNQFRSYAILSTHYKKHHFKNAPNIYSCIEISESAVYELF
jgi:hypothetical protein